jgi:hypothetical protein
MGLSLLMTVYRAGHQKPWKAVISKRLADLRNVARQLI